MVALIFRAARWPLFLTALALTQIAGARPVETTAAPEPHRPIPRALLEEHAEIRMALGVAVQAGGRTGAAAGQVLAVLDPHLAHEQRVALPPLRLLPRLASGEVNGDMASVLAITEQLRTEVPALRQEHVAIRRALETLWQVAWSDGQPEHAFLAQRINRHLDVDEEVLYPAALLVGEHVRRLVAPGNHRPPTE